MSVVPAPVREILRGGAFCHIASSTRSGPHVTPMVFAVAGGRIWVTTSRGSVKARAWRIDPRVAGMVRADEATVVVFTGSVTTYDLLDPQSWSRSVRESPLIGVAAARFTAKNARFFAGYAVDAHRVPLAWTPPGRVFAELRIERSAVLDDGRVSAWGEWGDRVIGIERFRASRTGGAPLGGLPAAVRDRLGESGTGVLALQTDDGPVALPARWAVEGSALYAVLEAETLELAEPTTGVAVSLEIDRASWWRARAMVGAMVRGDGEVAVIRELASGERSATRIVGLSGLDSSDAALVRIRPRSLVWWRGWASGTVAVR